MVHPTAGINAPADLRQLAHHQNSTHSHAACVGACLSSLGGASGCSTSREMGAGFGDSVLLFDPAQETVVGVHPVAELHDQVDVRFVECAIRAGRVRFVEIQKGSSPWPFVRFPFYSLGSASTEEGLSLLSVSTGGAEVRGPPFNCPVPWNPGHSCSWVVRSAHRPSSGLHGIPMLMIADDFMLPVSVALMRRCGRPRMPKCVSELGPESAKLAGWVSSAGVGGSVFRWPCALVSSAPWVSQIDDSSDAKH